MEKKGNVGVVVLVIILMLGCLCGGYFLSYKNIVSIGKTNEVKESNTVEVGDCTKEEALDVSSEEIAKLLLVTHSAHSSYCGYYGFFKDKKVTPNDISDKDIAKIVLLKVVNDKENGLEAKELTKKEFEDAAHALFGNDFKYKHASIESCPSYTYDETRGVYTQGSHECGGTCGPSNIERAVKAVRTDKGLDIYVRMLFIGYIVNNNIDDHNYYSDYKLTKKTNYNADDIMNRRVYEYDAITRQGSLYKVSYAKENDNYYLVSVEPVNE